MPGQRKYRIGIDVGGTNTDAVVLNCAENPGTQGQNSVVAWHKSPTTPDVTSGIASALESVLSKSGIVRDNILYLSIGTTHFLNAVIEADPGRLSRIAVLRLAGPYTARCPPFIDFPDRLRAVIEGHVAILDGGLEIDGKEITPINDQQIKEQCEVIRSKGIHNIVLVGVFSPLASVGTQEEYMKKIIEDTLGATNVNVVCSKDVGHVGLLERENASILNTAILSFARRTVKAYQQVLKRLDLHCPLFLTQLDGTLVPASIAASVPIRTFSNGPTNSMRGASFLAGLDKRRSSGNEKATKSVIVVDVGGTTTDVGVLLPSGFPRKAAAFTEVGGVRTSFSMPDIHSIGLGGGSRIRFADSRLVTVGPDSVGHAIQTSALVFGGDTLTASDLAIASGLAAPLDLSLPETVRSNVKVPNGQATAGMHAIQRMLENAIDRMKTEPGDSKLILVGGGSLIVPQTLSGISEIIKPPYHDVANAVGAAIARVSGTVDRVEIPGGSNGTLEEIVERCKEEAVGRAVASGADKTSVEVMEVTLIQLPYVANHASRIIVRAVGDLDFTVLENGPLFSELEIVADEPVEPFAAETVDPEVDGSEDIDPVSYRPNVSSDGVWTLSETDMEWIADGCAVLGCGGGGATYAAFLMARQSVRQGRKIRVINAEAVADPDAWILPCGFMGSPSVSSERIPSGEEIPTACKSLMKFLGVDSIAAIISDEIGGKNGLEPMLLASRDEFDLPVIDGDLMGRAYPRLNQILPCIFKENGLFPVAAADGVGNCMIVPTARNNPVVEDILRAACTVLGSSVALSICPLRAGELAKHTITGTTSQAWRIGKAIATCRKANDIGRIPKSIISLQGGKLLFIGKIVEVSREVRGGFTHGRIMIAPLAQDEQEASSNLDFASDKLRMSIPFQNENLSAEVVLPDGTRNVVCSVPDLVAVLDHQSGASIGTQDYRYGLRVTVLGLACDPRWSTPKGLEIGGPEAFGMETDYKPIAGYLAPNSVIGEFRRH